MRNFEDVLERSYTKPKNSVQEAIARAVVDATNKLRKMRAIRDMYEIMERGFTADELADALREISQKVTEKNGSF